jgi:hypothetical protein
VRFPRFFAKKRGHRRSVSEVWGSIAEGLFHAGLVLAGLVFGALLVTGVAVPEWRINHRFVEARGTVIGKGLARHTTARDRTWEPALRLRYDTAAGPIEAWAFQGDPIADRSGALSRLGDVLLGSDVPCWYDPDAPDAVVLARGYNWWMWALTLLLPGALLAFGGAGLTRSIASWRKSEERRAVTFHPIASDPHPAIPSCDDLVNSPGTVLRFRLPTSGAEGWTLVGFGLFALAWNTVLTVLAATAGSDLIGGQIDWLLFAILVPFAAVGIAGIVLFVRQLVLTSAVGTTQVEISDHPLRPGCTYDVLLAQAGSGTFKDLSITLELEEQATFRQGTDTRTERIVVWRSAIQSWRDVQLAPGTRFEAKTRLTLPAMAMHSFASEHNAVSWRVVVQGRPARWPAFARGFPVIVNPVEVTR